MSGRSIVFSGHWGLGTPIASATIVSSWRASAGPGVTAVSRRADRTIRRLQRLQPRAVRDGGPSVAPRARCRRVRLSEADHSANARALKRGCEPGASLHFAALRSASCHAAASLSPRGRPSGGAGRRRRRGVPVVASRAGLDCGPHGRCSCHHVVLARSRAPSPHAGGWTCGSGQLHGNDRSLHGPSLVLGAFAIGLGTIASRLGSDGNWGRGPNWGHQARAERLAGSDRRAGSCRKRRVMTVTRIASPFPATNCSRAASSVLGMVTVM